MCSAHPNMVKRKNYGISKGTFLNHQHRILKSEIIISKSNSITPIWSMVWCKYDYWQSNVLNKTLISPETIIQKWVCRLKSVFHMMNIILYFSEKTLPWKHLLYDYSQNTTFHGIRFVTLPTKFPIRRYVLYCSIHALLGTMSKVSINFENLIKFNVWPPPPAPKLNV